MFEINGKYTKALVLAETIEEECVSQIQNICNCEGVIKQEGGKFLNASAIKARCGRSETELFL